MEYIEHRVGQFERWDSISQQHYGTPFEIERLLRANPDVPRTPIVPIGTLLLVPVDKLPNPIDSRGLPPWLRF